MSYAPTLLFFIILSACDDGTRPRSRDAACCEDRIQNSEGEARMHPARELLGPGLGDFVFINGQEFNMGRNEGENQDERPEHVVRLSAFNIGRTPTTNTQFVRFLNETRIPTEEYFCNKVEAYKPAIKREHGEWHCADHTSSDAACCQSWELAERYCAWLSAKAGRKCRLPTEAEWEYVCRGKDNRTFPWGDDATELDSKIWGWRSWQRDKAELVPVGQFPGGATPEGVYDLIGYMDEVCSDWYDPEYYSISPRTNPSGPKAAPEHGRYKKAKVTRGGVERPHQGGGFLVRLFRDSEFLGILPAAYLPRGWSRGKTVAPTEPRFVYGRLGFRVVVEVDANCGS